jgi:hypothetical protein
MCIELVPSENAEAKDDISVSAFTADDLEKMDHFHKLSSLPIDKDNHISPILIKKKSEA